MPSLRVTRPSNGTTSGVVVPARRNSPVGDYGVSVSVAAFVTPAYEAEIVAVFFTETTFVFTVKVLEVAPAATFTLVGTTAALWLLASVITAPPAGADPDNVTVTREEMPPFTAIGFAVSEDRDREPPATALPVCTL